jgi:FkbM family methyltransferase
MSNQLIERASAAVGSVLPEGKLKETLRRYFYRYYNPVVLQSLNRTIYEAKLSGDRALLVELTDGAKFCAQPGKTIAHCIKYACPAHSDKLEGLEHFRPLWELLYELYVLDVYQRSYKLRKGDIAIDLGANIGVFTVKAARAVGDEGMVVAVEPEPDNLRLLRRNIEVNELKNVTVIEKGAWSRRERRKLFITEHMAGHNFLRQKDAVRLMEVEVDTLDNMLSELRMKRVHFIKMDIEGGEVEALKGMNEILKHNDVKLAIAAYHEVEGKQTYKTIAPWLRESGFQIYVKKGMVYGMKKRPL